MKSAVLFMLLCVASVRAHPGIGIVQDSRGNVYYTDLKQIWKIAPDGKKSIAVPNVHSHEICLDAEDNLYGEHLWYQGDKSGKWAHRVWQMKPDGSVADLFATRDGLLNDYGFARDRTGNVYWVELNEQKSIQRRLPNGIIQKHAAGDFRHAQWLTVARDGTIFLIVAGDLYRVTPQGKAELVAAKLSGINPAPRGVTDRNYHMGLWTDNQGDVFVAVQEEKLVLRVKPDGTSSVFTRSSDGWAPSGGTFDREGNLWLLEFGAKNAVRARRIDREGRSRVF